MSNQPELTIAGNNDLSSDMARHAVSSSLADPVYLWRDTQDPLVSQSPVVIVADETERAGFARTAIDAGLRAVSLPFSDMDDALTSAIERGDLRLISPVHGLDAMIQLYAECAEGRYGRRYGIYAARRLPRSASDEVTAALNDLSTYVTSLIDSSLVAMSATRTTAATNGFAGWFVMARFDDATIATIEVSAVLPESDAEGGELLVEVTGTDAMLRAEPGRQAVVVNGPNGVQRQPWYDEPSGPLLQHALDTLEYGRVDQQVSALKLIQNASAAATSASRLNLA